MKEGDKVKFVKENVLKSTGYLPKWYSTKIFTIESMTPEVDQYGYTIVKLKEKIEHSSNNYNTVTSYFLKIPLAEIRKQKLEKLNERR